jgi:hypothetical protein
MIGSELNLLVSKKACFVFNFGELFLLETFKVVLP